MRLTSSACGTREGSWTTSKRSNRAPLPSLLLVARHRSSAARRVGYPCTAASIALVESQYRAWLGIGSLYQELVGPGRCDAIMPSYVVSGSLRNCHPLRCCLYHQRARSCNRLLVYPARSLRLLMGTPLHTLAHSRSPSHHTIRYLISKVLSRGRPGRLMTPCRLLQVGAFLNCSSGYLVLGPSLHPY